MGVYIAVCTHCFLLPNLLFISRKLEAKMHLSVLLVCACAVALTGATILFEEQFTDGWEDRWVESTKKGSEAGKFKWSAGKFYADAEKDKGIQTSQDAKFYAISAKFDTFSNEDKD